MFVSLLLGLSAPAAIDRQAVVQRHNVHFQHATLDAATSAFDVLTVGNGELGFSADATGLQSLNGSYHTPRYPLYTLSNWGWHTPEPTSVGAKSAGFNADGTLHYTYVVLLAVLVLFGAGAVWCWC